MLAVSGSAALVYQALWVRQLALLLESTAQAATLAIAIFFIGLAAGGSLHPDEVCEADHPYGDAGGFHGSGTQGRVVGGSWDVFEVVDRPGVCVKCEAGTVGQRVWVGWVDIEQVGVHATKSGVEFEALNGWNLVTVLDAADCGLVSACAQSEITSREAMGATSLPE